jgi:hypothetical protein
MNETNNSLTIASGTTGTGISTITNGYTGTARLGYSETTINGYSGTTITNFTDGPGLTLSGNSTINYSTNLHINNMRTQQVHVAVFTVERNDKNEINSTKFVKELWVEQKNGTSIDLLVAKQLDKEFDPETTVVRVIYTVTF